MRDWVKKSYPGTKTAITEYNWGALDSMNGALAQADVLGIFGRERLDLATLWGPRRRHRPVGLCLPDVPQLRRPWRTVREHLGAGGQQRPGPTRGVRRHPRRTRR